MIAVSLIHVFEYIQVPLLTTLGTVYNCTHLHEFVRVCVHMCCYFGTIECLSLVPIVNSYVLVQTITEEKIPFMQDILNIKVTTFYSIPYFYLILCVYNDIYLFR